LSSIFVPHHTTPVGQAQRLLLEIASDLIRPETGVACTNAPHPLTPSPRGGARENRNLGLANSRNNSFLGETHETAANPSVPPTKPEGPQLDQKGTPSKKKAWRFKF
jgi:hypothetical protein